MREEEERRAEQRRTEEGEKESEQERWRQKKTERRENEARERLKGGEGEKRGESNNVIIIQEPLENRKKKSILICFPSALLAGNA